MNKGSRIGGHGILAPPGRAAWARSFRVFFSAGWIDNGTAFLVNRNASTSRIVLFDRFRSGEGGPARWATR